MKALTSFIVLFSTQSLSQYLFHPKEIYFSYLKVPTDCDFKGQNVTKLTIIVKSSTENFARRAAIRKTYGSPSHGLKNLTSQTFFELGLPNKLSTQKLIDKESSKYGDLLQADFIDTYRNITLKTVMGFEWATKNCLNTDFFLVVDDDVLVSVKNLLPTLTKYKRDDLLYMGEIVKKNKVIRDKKHRHPISNEDLEIEKYPPAINEAAVLYTHRAFQDISYMLPYTKHIWMDNAFIAFAASAMNIKPIGNRHFHIRNFPKYYKKVQVSHGFGNPEDLKKCWTLLESKYEILFARCFNNFRKVNRKISISKSRRKPTMFYGDKQKKSRRTKKKSKRGKK